MKLIKKSYLYFILCVSCAVSNAALPQWQIDPAQSELTFTATQNGAPVSGSFKTFSGEILVDPNNYKESSIHIVVDMNSLSASYAELTITLDNPQWFNVKMFPKAEFKATNFNRIGPKKYEALGTLTIRNKSAPVTLTFTAEESSPDHWIVNGQTIIKRSTFGVGQGEWASTKEIKDEVVVHFKVNASRKTER